MIFWACWASSMDWSRKSLPQPSRLWRWKYSEIAMYSWWAASSLPIWAMSSFRSSVLSIRPPCQCHAWSFADILPSLPAGLAFGSGRRPGDDPFDDLGLRVGVVLDVAPLTRGQVLLGAFV